MSDYYTKEELVKMAPPSSLTHALRTQVEVIRRIHAALLDQVGSLRVIGHPLTDFTRGEATMAGDILVSLDALLRQTAGTEPLIPRFSKTCLSVDRKLWLIKDGDRHIAETWSEVSADDLLALLNRWPHSEGTEPAPTPNAHIPGNRIPTHEQIPSLFEVQEGGYWIIKARCECGASDEWRQFTPTLASEWHAEHKATVSGEPVAAPPTTERER